MNNQQTIDLGTYVAVVMSSDINKSYLQEENYIIVT